MITIKPGQSLPKEVNRVKLLLDVSLALLTPGVVSCIYIGVNYETISSFGMRVCTIIYSLSFMNVVIVVGGTVFYGSSRLIRILDELLDAVAKKDAAKRQPSTSTPGGKAAVSNTPNPVEVSGAASKKEEKNPYKSLRLFHVVFLRMMCFGVCPAVILVLLFIMTPLGPLYFVHGTALVAFCGMISLIPVAAFNKGPTRK